jgi:thioredoxin 1
MNVTLITIGIIGAMVLYLVYNFRKMKNMPMVADSENIIHLTKQNFDHQTKTGISLVDFWADWCMPCKMMSPVLNDVANEINGAAKICKVDVQTHPDLSAKFGIRGIPTMILLQNGKEINRFVGAKSKDFLIKQIKQVQK